jgi:hypothetical protein
MTLRFPPFIAGLLVALLAAASASAQQAEPNLDLLADSLASLVREVIPRDYEKGDDWGKTKRITTGIKVHSWDFSRRKKEVPHGHWKKYHLELIDPDERLSVAVRNLRPLEEGAGAAMTLELATPLRGWAQSRNYNRGVHLLTLTAEADLEVAIAIDCEVRAKMTPKGFALDPKVTDSRLDLKKFDMHRLGELGHDLAEPLGKGIKKLVEDELDGPALTAKLNRAIDKKRDRLVLSPGKLWEN